MTLTGLLTIPLNKSICTSRPSRKKADLLEHTLNHSKDIDLERAKEFHCELCQKDWKKWKFLSDHISKYHSDIHKAQNLYESLRLERIKKISNLSLRQGFLNHLSNPLMVFLRNFVMKFFPYFVRPTMIIL